MRIVRRPWRSYAFSLIELLIALSIGAIIMAIAVPSWNSYNNRMIVLTNANEFAAELREARNNALRSGYDMFFRYSVSKNIKTYYSKRNIGKAASISITRGVPVGGGAAWSYSEVNAVFDKKRTLDSRVDLYADATSASALTSAKLRFDTDGRVSSTEDNSGFTKVDNNYVIYVGRGSYRIPVKVTKIGSVVVG